MDVAIDLKGYGSLISGPPIAGFVGKTGVSGFINGNFAGEKEEADAEVTTAGIYKFGVVKMGETKGNYILSIQ